MSLPLGLVLGLNLPSNPDHRLLARQTGVLPYRMLFGGAVVSKLRR
jgi:hypothetical protein